MFMNMAASSNNRDSKGCFVQMLTLFNIGTFYSLVDEKSAGETKCQFKIDQCWRWVWLA